MSVSADLEHEILDRRARGFLLRMGLHVASVVAQKRDQAIVDAKVWP